MHVDLSFFGGYPKEYSNDVPRKIYRYAFLRYSYKQLIYYRLSFEILSSKLVSNSVLFEFSPRTEALIHF